MQKNISVIYGNEDFLIEKHVKDLAIKVLGPDKISNNFAMEILDPENASITNIINACQSMGMFSTDKVVIVRDFYLLSAKAEKIEKETSSKEEFEIQNLQSVLENIDPATNLLFVNNGNVDNRKKFAKYLKTVADFVEYKSFASWEGEKVVDWLKKQVKTSGKTIDEKAVFLLHSIVGENLRMLDNEVQKLITYIGSNAQITVADVETMVSSAGASSFMLLDCLVEGNSAKSMDLIAKILYFGEEPIKLLGLMVSHFRGLLMIKSLSAQNMQSGDVAKLCGKHPFIVKTIMGTIRTLTVRNFVDIMDLLCKADLAIKTGQLKPDLCLELLCQDILGVTGKIK